MKKERKKQVSKFIVIFLIMIVVIPVFNNIFGEINENYKGSEVITSSGVGGDETPNPLSRPIFWLINTCAEIGEYLLSSFASLMASGESGRGIMPWADAIIYNGVPALDVNFINPDTNSFSNVLSGTIAKLYYTIFSITITFFTVAVLIMAIKLATTAIAAEKARYKEMVGNFIISLILIFSIHYFISFCFYLNESLVKVAFAVGQVQLEGESVRIDSNAKGRFDGLVNSYSEDLYVRNLDVDEYARLHENLLKHIREDMFDGGKKEQVFSYLSPTITQFLNTNDGDLTRNACQTEKSVIVFCMVHLVNDNYVNRDVIFTNNQKYSKNENELYNELKKYYDKFFYDIIDKDTLMTEFGIESTSRPFEDVYKDCFDVDNIGSTREYMSSEKDVIDGINEAVLRMRSTYGYENSSLKEYGNSVVSQLSVYFKLNRYDAEGEINLIGVIVYTIFVFQSVMYFFAYLKRFFYIVILSFFGPFLVLFDFLSKAVGQNSNTLSKWIREFCSLVFIQTLQAFLLTMIATLIVKINGKVADLEFNQAQGLAVINIIALASMAKLEQLVSDMIGIKSSVTDVGLKGGAKMALHGLAGGVATMAALRRLGDNGKKMLGGVRGIAAGRREQKNALAEKNRKMNQYAELLAQGGGAGGSAGEGEAGEGAPGGLGGGAGNGGSSTGTAGGRPLNIRDKHKYQDMLANCDAKIMEARNKKKAAIYQITSGVFETAGSVAGFTTGAALAGTMHAAAGDFSLGDVLSDAVKGAGVGDVLGEAALSIPTGVASFGKDVKAGSGKNALIREIKQKQEIIKNAYRKAGFDVSDLE